MGREQAESVPVGDFKKVSWRRLGLICDFKK